jgi:hypothetical protein
MNISITSKAMEKLREVFKTSDFKNPGIRLLYNGYG